jgi:hypothetical protein
MKVYLVGDYEQRELFDVIRRVLEQSGFEVVSWWMCHDGRRHYKNIMLNYQDIEKADIVIGFYPFGERAHSELTYALLKKKITILVIALGHAHQHPPIMYLVDEYKNGFIIDSSLFYEYIIDKKIDITQKEDLIDVLKQHHFKSSDFDPSIGKDTFQCPIPKEVCDEICNPDKTKIKEKSVFEMKSWDEITSPSFPTKGVFGGMCNFCEKFNRKKK